MPRVPPRDPVAPARRSSRSGLATDPRRAAMAESEIPSSTTRSRPRRLRSLPTCCGTTTQRGHQAIPRSRGSDPAWTSWKRIISWRGTTRRRRTRKRRTRSPVPSGASSPGRIRERGERTKTMRPESARSTWNPSKQRGNSSRRKSRRWPRRRASSGTRASSKSISPGPSPRPRESRVRRRRTRPASTS